MKLSVREIPGQHDPDVALLELSGAIDADTVEPFDRALDEARRRGKRHLVIDLAGVRYVNSTGFGFLIKHATAVEAAGGGLSLVGVPARVAIVLEMLGIGPSFVLVCKERPGAFAAGRLAS